VVLAIAEVISVERAANSEIIRAAPVGATIISVSCGALAGDTDHGLHFDDQVVRQVVALVVAEIGSFGAVAHLSQSVSIQ
jgi:hypothetical protein